MRKLQKSRVQTKIDELVLREFKFFLFDKWKISSGEFKGDKFSCKDTPCLMELITDEFPFQVTLKSAQSRISELHVAKAIFRVISRKGNILYAFPAGEQMEQFVDARVRPAVVDNEFLFKYVTGSLNLKKFSLNNNSLYFRGAQKRRQMISVDVSVVYADEIAEYEEGVIYTLDKRLGGVANPERYYYSTPKFTGNDIALYYYGDDAQKERGSDQRVWCIKCTKCNKWNEDLVWEENVIDLNYDIRKFSHYEPNTIVICRHCKEPLNRLSNGEWVAKVPKNSSYCHGRHISKLFFPTSNLNKMMEDSINPVKEQEFWNSDMGLPYEVKGARLTDSVIDNCRGVHLLTHKSQEDCYIGTDIGNKIHSVISVLGPNNIPKVISVQELNSWHNLRYLHKLYNVKSHVIDMNPDKDEAIEFQKEFPNTYLSYFKTALENTSELFEIDDDNHIIPTHRTLLMSRLLDMFHEQQIILPIDIKTVRDFYPHLTSIVKALKQDNMNNWVAFYPKMGKPDHYFFALMYNLIATQLRPKPSIFRILRTTLI